MDARLRALAALLVDLGLVALFALLGRSAHGEALTDFPRIVWPFAVGAVAGWVAVRGWRAPTAIAPTGVAVWASAVLVGVLLRLVTGQDAPFPMVFVAGFVLGAFLLGWRVLIVAGDRASRRPPEARLLRRRR